MLRRGRADVGVGGQRGQLDVAVEQLLAQVLVVVRHHQLDRALELRAQVVGDRLVRGRSTSSRDE